MMDYHSACLTSRGDFLVFLWQWHRLLLNMTYDIDRKEKGFLGRGSNSTPMSMHDLAYPGSDGNESYC